MENDPILEEIHRLQEEYAAWFNYALKAIHQDLKAREEQGEFVVMHRTPRAPKAKVAPKKYAAE